MDNYDWGKPNHLQIGRYGESLVKLELTRLGCDVYTSDVDDRGIDFIVCLDANKYFDIQVKTIRAYGYVYAEKTKFQSSSNLYMAAVLLIQNRKPQVFLIPRARWDSPDSVFVSNDYPTGKSKPDWGINISKKNLPSLVEFAIDRVACDMNQS